jgi:hypothetical protein
MQYSGQALRLCLSFLVKIKAVPARTCTARELGLVMRNQPAVFLKLLVLLVPREMKLEHTGGVKAMTDEQLERSIELIQEMIAKREAGSDAKVIEGVAEPVRTRKPRGTAQEPTRVVDNPNK